MIKHLIVALGIAALMSTSALAASSKAAPKSTSAKVVKKVAQDEGEKPVKAKKAKKGKGKKAKTPAPEEAPAE
jgi:hypothetical protein